MFPSLVNSPIIFRLMSHTSSSGHPLVLSPVLSDFPSLSSSFWIASIFWVSLLRCVLGIFCYFFVFCLLGSVSMTKVLFLWHRLLYSVLVTIFLSESPSLRLQRLIPQKWAWSHLPFKIITHYHTTKKLN
jgi:ABC-type multidrug transport system permease subunit